MAKKDEKTNVMRVLEQKGIPYTPHTYPHDGNAAPDGLAMAGPWARTGVRVQNPGGPGGLRRAVRL